MQAGDRLGEWVLEAQLGEGGMGTVWRCRHAGLDGIHAAVKVVRPDALVPQAAERFEREVRALYGLRHPAIVRVNGFGNDDGALWLAMELIEGETLSSRIARGPMSPDEAREVFGALADGLAHAHARGVAHRDIKPANIVLDSDGKPILVDFGIALDDSRTRLTADGVVPGTPAYMAPEVFAMAGGTPEGGDIYALGQVLCEALTGGPAFDEPEHMSGGQRLVWLMSAKGRQAALDPGPGVPADLRQLIRHATALDPKLRLQSAAELGRRLRALPAQEAVEVRRRAPPWLVVVPLAVIAAVGVALGLATAWALWPDPGDTDIADTEIADTEIADTDIADTDVADTDVADTDVADTDAGVTTHGSATTTAVRPAGPCPTVAACLELVERHRYGRGVPKDDVRAATYREHACRLGSAEACYETAWRVSAGKHGYTEPDPVATLDWFARGCALGNVESCKRRGSMLWTGADVPRDGAASHGAYRAACDLGDAESCYRAGTGPVTGAAPPDREGCALFDRSCALSYASGCASSAECYRKGTGGTQDLGTAARRLARACDLGNPYSCRRLGGFTARGEGVPDSDVPASAWFDRARTRLAADCDTGTSASALQCSTLGEMAQNGEGQAVDLEAAKALYVKACDLGFTPACQYAARIP